MPDNSTTPRRFAAKYAHDRDQAFRRQPGDGPVVTIFKWFFGRSWWHLPIEWYIERGLSRKCPIDQPIAEQQVMLDFNQTVQEFWLCWTLGITAVYGIAFWAAYQGPVETLPPDPAMYRAVLLGLLAVVSVFRTLEILAVSFRLHVMEHYWTGNPAHALLLTFLAYFQVMLCFGVLYLSESFLTGDKFNEHSPMGAELLNAAYFSTTTIATLGFGDYSPSHWIGKLLVIGEAFVGLILIVVAFQRVIAASANPPSSPPPDPSANDAQGPP